jgi:hypothetical protein
VRLERGPGRERQVVDLQQLLRELAWALSPAQADEALDLIPWQWTGSTLTLLGVLARGDEAARARRAEILPRVLEILRDRPGIDRGIGLAVSVRYLTQDERGPAIDAAFAEARREGDERGGQDNRSAVLFYLAPFLDEAHVERFVRLAMDGLRDNLAVGDVVARLPERLRGSVTERLLALAGPLDTHEVLIAGLAPHAAPAALERIVEALERRARSNNAILAVVPGVAARHT